MEEGQLDGKRGSFDLSAELLDEPRGCCGSAAGGEQVVADNHALAGLHGVFVNLQRVRAIFQLVRDAGGFGGQFFRLAHRDESGAEPIGERWSKNKPACFDPRDNVNRVVLVVLAQPVNQDAKA